MRILITEAAGNLEALTASLTRSKRGAASALERIKALNPHLADVRKLEPGTVVVLPDAPELKPGVGDPVAGTALADLTDGVQAALRATEDRVAVRLERLNADVAAVRDALKSAAAKRLVQGNPALREQLQAAQAQFKAEQKSITETRGALAEFRKLVQSELAALQKIAF